jgi:hypothetical protein
MVAVLARLPWQEQPMNRIPRRPGTLRAPSWPVTRAAICLAAYLAAAALAWALAPDQPQSTAEKPLSAAASDAEPPPKTDHRIREGTRLVDQRGVFKMTGQRVTFFPSNGQGRFVALENLNLERIARALTDSPSPQEWVVSGTVTEYQGVNFLLVERAVLKQRTEIVGAAR